VGLFVLLFYNYVFSPDIKEMLDEMGKITILMLVTAGSIEIALSAVLLPPIVLTSQRAMPKLFREINSTRTHNTTDKPQEIKQQ
jgi:hypothetical protein